MGVRVKVWLLGWFHDSGVIRQWLWLCESLVIGVSLSAVGVCGRFKSW